MNTEEACVHSMNLFFVGTTLYHMYTLATEISVWMLCLY